MIKQYLSNKNENATVSKSKNFLNLNKTRPELDDYQKMGDYSEKYASYVPE